jgi:hypothetical protein
MRVETLEYLEFLRQRKEEERRLEAELDRLTAEALGRDNAKRDMQMLKEELARQELMRQVKQTRSDQMTEKRTPLRCVHVHVHLCMCNVPPPCL